MTSQTPEQIYRARCARFEELRDAERIRSRVLSTARLLAFLAAVAAAVVAELSPGPLPIVFTGVAVVAFVVLIVAHGRLRQREQRYERLRALNEQGLSRLRRDWSALPARPAQIEDAPHATDLDLFGRPALAQLLGPTATPLARRVLAGWLMRPPDAATIRARQQAVQELSSQVELREALAESAGELESVRTEEVDRFLDWAESDGVLARKRALVVAAYVLPVLTVALIVLDATGVIEPPLWAFSILAIAVVSQRARAVRAALSRAFEKEGIFRGYPQMLEALAAARFEAPALVGLQHALETEGEPAASAMARLRRLMHLADVRHSALTHAIVQVLTFWDVHVLRAVESWQRRAGPSVRRWLDNLAEVESLCALATLAHDHPDWTFADIAEDGPPVLAAQALGHPMIGDGDRVDNDVTLGPPGTFLLVTGSNMSGKSTLLRAIGQNAVLALAGGPARAASLRLPVLDVQTAIHVQDSLVDGVSFFLAQLHRMKRIVEAADAAREGRPILYLLDEILQGTNTAERRIAAARVTAHLLRCHAIGAVTTHDLELADHPDLAQPAQAVHFSEQVRRGEDGPVMTFDYLLRPGVATSTNALALMEIVGLD
jgi:ABC-type multidrug transport system fused ATPase/permease subunit